MAIDSLPRGGRERRMLALASDLVLRGIYEIHVVIFNDVNEYQDEVSKLHINLYVIPRWPKKDPRAFWRVYRLCRRLKPDLVHCWADMSAIYMIPAATILGIPILNGCIVNAPVHSKWWYSKQMRTRITFPFSNVIVANSQAGLKAYQVPESKGLCIYNGFDFHRLSEVDSVERLREELNITTRYVVAMVAAFQDRKDYITYVEAAMEVLGSRDDVTFLAIGEGANRPTIENMVPSIYTKRILFTGLRLDIEKLLGIVDIGVLCTNTEIHGEGVSNALIECMACEVPVIATKGGGTDETVLHGETGFTISPKD
ncbi:MAG: glycosyltransferase, partial [Saprospiraceae bacterium]|nr:glycosyltransferase [Saprospiraceae bacterium]